MKDIFTILLIMMMMTTKGQDIHGHSGQSGVIFSGFPVHQEDYARDVKEIMDETIKKYGEEEWRLVALTSEIHGHLGIYAIIGAKMGLYAKEILEAGHDELRITSYAGSKPPVSCLNDGLQVSTGATLGHGLIKIGESESPLPAATFTLHDKSIRLTLKRDIFAGIENQIKAALKESGGLTPAYWVRIRELGLAVWKGYDRKGLFEVIEGTGTLKIN
ncbi:MAG: formylmethanofuran dehydrogenase subunit E family protein [Bacteroidales bacterium]|nr:formylmethanofuran dehydrogenase subunit E family protein [Bacteroidales bacterium]